MAAQKVQKLINLLPQEEFTSSTMGRILSWAMGTFRYLVIGIEMIVMVAFLSRFWLDARNVDLNDLIRDRAAVISSQSDFEKEFRDLQKRIKIFSEIAGADTLPSDYLTTIISYMPGDIRLDGIQGTAKEFVIKGNSFNEISISQFLVNLDKSGGYEKVQITNLDSKQEDGGLIVFTMKLIPKKGNG